MSPPGPDALRWGDLELLLSVCRAARAGMGALAMSCYAGDLEPGWCASASP